MNQSRLSLTDKDRKEKERKTYSKYGPGLNLWLEIDRDAVFCQGRALLLHRIKENGSLRQAAKSLGMSYRAAWGKLKKTQDILGYELVILTGSRPRRYELTRQGDEFLSAYNAWLEKVRRYAALEADEFDLFFRPSSLKDVPRLPPEADKD